MAGLLASQRQALGATPFALLCAALSLLLSVVPSSRISSSAPPSQRRDNLDQAQVSGFMSIPYRCVSN
ncbi:hypothetical protein M8494_20215 [Serratia ureilytica]